MPNLHRRDVHGGDLTAAQLMIVGRHCSGPYAVGRARCRGCTVRYATPGDLPRCLWLLFERVVSNPGVIEEALRSLVPRSNSQAEGRSHRVRVLDSQRETRAVASGTDW